MVKNRGGENGIILLGGENGISPPTSLQAVVYSLGVLHSYIKLPKSRLFAIYLSTINFHLRGAQVNILRTCS